MTTEEAGARAEVAQEFWRLLAEEGDEDAAIDLCACIALAAAIRWAWDPVLYTEDGIRVFLTRT